MKSIERILFLGSIVGLILMNHLALWQVCFFFYLFWVTRNVRIKNYQGLKIFVLLSIVGVLFSWWMNPPNFFFQDVAINALKTILFSFIVLVFTNVTRDELIEPIQYQKRYILIVLCLLVGIYVPMLIAFSPGNLYIDSYSQWGQAMGGIMPTDWHPFFTTLLLKISYKLVGTPILYTLLQVAYSIVTLVYFAQLLLREKVKKSYINLALLFIITCTLLVSNMVTLYKDNLYNMAFVLLVLHLFVIYVKDVNWLKRPSNFLVFNMNMVVVLLGRHNGLYVLVAFLVIWVLLDPYQRKSALMTIILMVFVFNVYKGPIFDRYDVKSGSPSEKYSMILQHIGAVVAQDKFLVDEEVAFLSQIMPLEIWKEKYHPAMVDPVKFHPSFNREIINQNQKRILNTWVTLLKKYPLIMIKAELQQIRPLWDITGWEHGLPGTQMYHYIIHSPKAYYDPYILSYDFEVESLRQFITNISYAQAPHDRTVKPFITSISGWSVYYLCSVIVGSLRMRQWKKLLILLPIIFHIGTLILAMPAYNMRYILGVTISLFCLAVLFKVNDLNR